MHAQFQKEDGELRVSFRQGNTAAVYDGPLAVTPTEETQVLLTAGLIVAENIEVKPIPSNYGRIGWNGAALTVS
ncbi:MAG: hypothetical protein IJV41_01300 [Oscillospiraceae bacterium]|nr:hypothetical protein [Oscillospiraceae bacterium]